MTMVRNLFQAALLCVLTASPALADPEDAKCLQAWTSLDADRNGVLNREEDREGAIDRSVARGTAQAERGQITRDDYLSLCSGKAVNESGTQKTGEGTLTQSSPNLPADRGKGDLTPGKPKLSEQDVRKRLESQGFKSIGDLSLGDDGIWRGTVEMSPGKRTPVGVDAQGDVLAQ